jgi:hypothetical protein
MNALKSVSACFMAAVAMGLLGAGWTPPVMAQSVCGSCSTEAEILTYLTTQAQPPAVQGSNSATTTQVGSGNTATSDMTVPLSVSAAGGSYFGNTTMQMQFGSNNTSTLQAVGNSNTLVTSQTGNNNNTAITAYGSGNTFASTQTGNNLSYTLQRVGNGQAISVSQRN